MITEFIKQFINTLERMGYDVVNFPEHEFIEIRLITSKGFGAMVRVDYSLLYNESIDEVYEGIVRTMNSRIMEHF